MPSQIVIHNKGQINTVRIRLQDAVVDADGKPTGKWKPLTTVVYVKPNEHGDVWLGASRRITIEEVPT